MFSFDLAQEFKKRARAAILFPRSAAAAATAAPVAHSTKFGAYASLAAIVLGGALMMANVAREHRAAAAVAAATPAPPAIEAVALAPPKADPPKVAPVAATPAPAPAPEKSTARIDTMPIGAISDTPKLKGKHKHHPKKVKPLDNDP